MKYYKILNENTFIGVANSGNFVAENQRTGWLLTSNENLGQFVSYEGQLYRDYWMQPVHNSKHTFTNVSIEEISKEEYDILIAAIEHDEEIIIDDGDDEEEPIPVEPIPEDPDIVLEYVRSSKIKEMSSTCRKAIENGFDLMLSDGKTHHFSLSAQDQMNLLVLSTKVDTEEKISYHADGELSKSYSAAEMKQIIEQAENHKNYHTIYFNALKAYINSLDNIDDIAAITYGVSIPDKFQSEVWKVLNK